MKKLHVLYLLLLLSVSLPAGAQNNPFGIDDECFRHYQAADALVGKEGFRKENDLLLSTAVAKGDTKAQTLYYVERFKNLTRSLNGVQATPETDAQVQKYMADLQSVALKLGYRQYYYFAYELAQNYYYNHGQFVRTMDLVQEMQRKAIADGDEYGKWMASRYLVALYIDQNDYVSAKKYIVEALRIYNSASDPTLRRQSPSRLYCDLADTYPIGHDSVVINISRAFETSKQHLDTLRVQYHLAKLYAYKKNIPAYERARDYCLRDARLLSQISNTADTLFLNIDRIVYGKGMDSVRVDGMMEHLREVKYIANIAEEYGYKDEAFAIEKQLVALQERKFAVLNGSRVTELDARMGNNRLNADLARSEAEISRLIIALTAAAVLILAIIVIFMFDNAKSLRRRNRELILANEKVLQANAAKTRFVQNMSHEVRTPLNAIVGFSQLLALPDGTFSPEEKDEFSSHIINNTKMLTMLLDDILNTSAMDNGTYNIKFDEGECNFMCQAAISSAEHRLQPGVTMTYEGGLDGPHIVWTDPQRVQQILINLLTNSCKHTSEGYIHLNCSLTEAPGFVTFAVTDTGPGVPADQAEAIFDRFTKLNEFVQGTGLGLSICRDIASRMDARVFLDTSWEGPGARFVFQLPDKQKPLNSQ